MCNCVSLCVCVCVCVCPFLLRLLCLIRYYFRLLLVRDLLLLAEQHQIIGHDVAYVQIDDPVHQVEADEADREHDSRVLVDIRGCNS